MSRLLPAMAALALLPGCRSPFDRPEDELIGPDLETLHEIDTVDLQEHSGAPPVTVEEAAESSIEQMLDDRVPEERIELAIADVRSKALANNLDLKVELVNPSIAQSAVDEEEAKFEATFFGSARYRRSDQPVEFATQSSQAELANFLVGLDVPLRTGGTVTIDMPFGRSDTDNPFSILNPAFDAAVRFSISQPLLRGAGVEANTYSIKVARYQRRIADARTKLEAIRILANADRVYWLLYAAWRQLEVRVQEYELAIEQLESARRKVLAGDVAEIEVTRAESGVASSLEQIILAETVLRQRQRDLKRIMNDPELPFESETALAAATDPDPVYFDLDPEKLSEYAVANRMEMLELELQLAIDAATVDLQKNAALPLFTVDYAYNVNGRASSWGGAYDQIGASQFTGWSVGLNAEIPIGNEAAKARIRNAVLTRIQRLATKDQRRLAIQQEVYDAVDILDQQWQRILAARQAVILAARTWEAERRQFDVGLRTSTDVLDAAARLADAQSAEVRALVDYEIARVDIAFGTGTLLGYGQIVWEPTTIEEPGGAGRRP